MLIINNNGNMILTSNNVSRIAICKLLILFFNNHEILL